ncbi:MAG: efflux RND transporter periplasmic adaptor subunit [Desulfosporosinus sp.]|nr:efflux RND transporter periplasmic adaptor subunit [Desulfosporosinus sp.]
MNIKNPFKKNSFIKKNLIKNKKNHILPLFIVILITIALLSKANGLTGDGIVQPVSKNLVVQSNVSMTDTNINSQVAGKIKEVKVKENEVVKKGQILITLESDTLLAQQAQALAKIDTVNAKIASARSSKTSALAQLEKVQSGARADELVQLKAAYDLAEVNYNRTKTLYEENVISKAELDSVLTQYTITKAQYDLAKTGARAEDIEIAKAQVSIAEAAIQSLEGELGQENANLAETRTYIAKTTITAPCAGIITQLNVETGELVSTGMPLLIITDSASPWIQCNVKETDLSKVRAGQTVSIRLAAYPNETFNGKITAINKNADFAVKRATNDNGEFDILSFGVKAELTDIKEPLNAGMTAFVDFGQ